MNKPLGMPRSTYRNGVNLGGWISQYRDAGSEHFNAFITEVDIKRIASWGMDHVRLPVDCTVIEAPQPPHAPRAEGLAYIDACLQWCAQAGLKLVLDLHKAPGYSFDELAENALFTNPAFQARMLRIWENLAHRYRGQHPEMVFELLNEVVLPDSAPWNALALELVGAIRAIDPQRLIMIGGNHYSAVSELVNVVRIDDPRILYTFHFYEPLPFTHQLAHWVPELVAWGGTPDYPGELASLGPFLAAHPECRARLGAFEGIEMNREQMRAQLQPALDFIEETGAPLYCGEFGVIERAPMPARLRWTRDLVGLLAEFGIGRAAWSYKAMDFGLVDAGGNVVSDALVAATCERWRE